ncbi:MAG: AAA family ATPase, partial [Acidimicrobiales bacterium]
MFLKSLTLKGFKSFADATTLEFEPGVTVVVGPNGSGKSNVVDAVAWVLGAQGPRTLRSSKMEDVIFAGTPKRPALGRSEVSLTIDNSAGLLPIEFSEVTITRTLFRTGESEYAINRVPCRLLDIQELLSDTGVGRQQHVIVSQGNLDTILSSRAEERRLVIEEAAGVLKYRRRKEKSERRLESTESSLVRLQDLLREVRRQLRPLEKQADAARRHGDLVEELAAVRRYLAGRDLATIEGRLAAAQRTRHELADAGEHLKSALAGLDADVVTAEAEADG